MRQKFEQLPNITVLTETSCGEITEDEILCRHPDGTEQRIAYDHLILSTGLVPKDEEANSFFGITRNTVSIGDCVHPSNIMNAVFEGYTAALNI